MCPGVARAAQGQPAEVHLLAVGHAADGELVAAGTGHEQLGAGHAKLSSAGHEVGMQVRLHGVGDLEPAPVRLGQVAGGMAGRVDHQAAAVAEVHEVGRVAQALVDEGDRRRRLIDHADLRCPGAVVCMAVLVAKRVPHAVILRPHLNHCQVVV